MQLVCDTAKKLIDNAHAGGVSPFLLCSTYRSASRASTVALLLQLDIQVE